MMSIRSSWPRAQWNLRAALMAHSTASVPELVKKTTSAKVASVRAEASFACSGIVKMFDTCQSLSAWALRAAISLGWECPRALTAIPARASR